MKAATTFAIIILAALAFFPFRAPAQLTSEDAALRGLLVARLRDKTKATDFDDYAQLVRWSKFLGNCGRIRITKLRAEKILGKPVESIKKEDVPAVLNELLAAGC